MLSAPIAAGSPVTLGWPIGAAVIIFPWLLTIYYVRQTNAEGRAMSTIVTEALA